MSADTLPSHVFAGSRVFFKIELFFLDTLILEIYFYVIKINDFLGDLNG